MQSVKNRMAWEIFRRKVHFGNLLVFGGFIIVSRFYRNLFDDVRDDKNGGKKVEYKREQVSCKGAVRVSQKAK